MEVGPMVVLISHRLDKMASGKEEACCRLLNIGRQVVMMYIISLRALFQTWFLSQVVLTERARLASSIVR